MAELTEEQQEELKALKFAAFDKAADMLAAFDAVQAYEGEHGLPMSMGWSRSDGVSLTWHPHGINEVHVICQWPADNVVAKQ